MQHACFIFKVADRMQSIRAPRTSGGYSQARSAGECPTPDGLCVRESNLALLTEAAKSGSKSLGIEKWKARSSSASSALLCSAALGLEL